MDGISRRRFLEIAASGAAMLPLRGFNMAGAPRQVLVPADKGLSPTWLASLTKRGKPTVYKGKALANIGMPIGGIGCGQVYLGGDGRLWHWDVFNQLGEGDMGGIRDGAHYAKPMEPQSPFQMGFYLARRTPQGYLMNFLDSRGYPDAEFEGRYPMASVRYGEYADVAVRLEAYSPFIPLNEDDSGLPVAVLTYTLESRVDVEVEIVGWMENPACLYSRNRREVSLSTEGFREGGLTMFEHRAADRLPAQAARADIVFEDFEKSTYAGWTSEGDAFGDGPIEIAKIPAYQGNVKGKGKRVVNSHNTRQGEDVAGGDAHVGKLVSPAFKIERRYIALLVGGGNHPGQTCVNLVLDGKVVRTTEGRGSNEMRAVTWDVRDWEGRTTHIEIVDQVKGAWGNIGVDQIVFSDTVPHEAARAEDEGDYGTAGIGVLGAGNLGAQNNSWSDFRKMALNGLEAECVGRRLALKPGKPQTVTFLVPWHFPNPNRKSLSFLQGHETFKRYYAKRFRSARDVAGYVAKNFRRLDGTTRLWTETWYDSTLPYWFLDRTMANTSTLSTSTVYRFDDGRFYGWEGIYCCAGTCTHVWQYAQAVGRLFPALERDTRKRVDYGIAYHDNGALGHRAEAWQDPATDGQCGTILRVYREHLMTKDSTWLRSIWPRVKKSIEFMIAQDPNLDGILEGPQFNTLDATWYGKIAWISSLYVAALRAGEAMARSMGDVRFEELCAKIAEGGKHYIAHQLFNDEYFIQKPDPKFPKAINTNDGCHIDQVFGQSWAFQVGLPRVLDESRTKVALKSLFRYNFAPDVGKYRSAMKAIKGGRWYAMPGEPGLLMCTWPRGGAEKAPGEGQADWAVGYFNECMTGFEHQVAAHMLYEGMVQEALIVEKTIHERYDGKKRNPYNEIECSDHYARAMASYGVFLAAGGFEYDGPNETLGIAPKMPGSTFKSAYTSAESWGGIELVRAPKRQVCRISVKYGTFRIRKLVLDCPATWIKPTLRTPNGELVEGKRLEDGKVAFAVKPLVSKAGSRVEFVATSS